MHAMKTSFKPSNQQGATLIVVLMVLLLIMVAGVMAVRQSRVDLQVATGDQINTVLLQTADNANQKLEFLINHGDTFSQDYADVVYEKNGLFGYFYGSPDRASHELIYCQTPTTKKYVAATSTVRADGGTIYSAGYCANTSNALTYTSGRNVIVGQVSLTPTPMTAENAGPPLSKLTIGQNTDGRTTQKMQFDIRSTAAIPAYTKSSTSAVAACFRNSSIPAPGVTTVDQCLQGLSVPQTTVYQQADLEQMSEITVCRDFGVSNYNTDCPTS